MQLELSNFQPLAANEAVEQEVQDLDGAGQLSAPMIESDQELASLIRSVGMTSITDIDNLVSELQDVRNHLQFRRGAHPSRDSPLYGAYGGRFGVGKDHP